MTYNLSRKSPGFIKDLHYRIAPLCHRLSSVRRRTAQDCEHPSLIQTVMGNSGKDRTQQMGTLLFKGPTVDVPVSEELTGMDATRGLIRMRTESRDL
jgi:hypothetical protein